MSSPCSAKGSYGTQTDGAFEPDFGSASLFASMLITNDVALITFVPFTIVVLSMIQRRQYLIYLIVLQTIAANLGSMAAPVGNPQSLFLYEKFHLSAGGYFRLMLPFVLASLVCLAAAALLVKNETIQVEFPPGKP